VDQGPWFFSAVGFLGRSLVESTRHPAPGLTAKGDYRVSWAGASLAVGHKSVINDWGLTPRLSGTYSSTRMGSFTESGAGNLNLAYSGARVESLEFELGALVTRQVPLGDSGRHITPKLNLGVAYEAMDTQVTVTSSFAEIPGLPAFTARSADFGRFRFIAETGVEIELTDNVNLSLDYRGSFRRSESNHGVTLGLGLVY
jgi:outer membrane autotransporter protein